MSKRNIGRQLLPFVPSLSFWKLVLSQPLTNPFSVIGSVICVVVAGSALVIAAHIASGIALFYYGTTLTFLGVNLVSIAIAATLAVAWISLGLLEGKVRRELRSREIRLALNNSTQPNTHEES